MQDPSAHYDLVLTSLPMPEGDPLRLASRLRAEVETRDLPLMLIARTQKQAMWFGVVVGTLGVVSVFAAVYFVR